MDCRLIIEKLRKEQDAQMEELRFLLEHLDEESSAYLRAAAAEEAALWQKDLSARADRVYQLLQK